MSARKRHEATHSHDMRAEAVGLMGKFSQFDAEAQATLGAVVEAVAHLSALNEARILDLVSAGRVADLFALKPVGDEAIPSDTVAEEASP
jgi:hypothetical protein